ncbi:hypothetical protein CO046_01570 [Candidatus Peregrinibacteria bacterium CG_4_9_14_0_2_um_filter_53_11]|nr:MAG: hypothetical protein CO046_01570 [Candidatus Peregrinibacteria bacterium CG_4_9_14_0_2_um_filter_53_11]
MDPTQNTKLTPEEQQKLNQPLAKSQGISQEDQAFLDMVIAKIESKEINLLSPSSIINNAVYDKLTEEQQGAVDFDAVNLVASLRRINDLCKLDHSASYQLEYLVHEVRLTKERFETLSGDVYII